MSKQIQKSKYDGFVKSRKSAFSVIPAEAGIQEYQGLLDPGFRRGDGLGDFLRVRQILMARKSEQQLRSDVVLNFEN
jgi:hypothetical protein